MLLEQISGRVAGSELLLAVVEGEMVLHAAGEHDQTYKCSPPHGFHRLRTQAVSRRISSSCHDTAYRLARYAVSWAAVALVRQIQTAVV